jgi:hypothetical protein
MGPLINSQITMDSGHTYPFGKRVSVIGLRFFAASRGARSVTDVSPTTIPTPRDAHNADTSPSEICAIRILYPQQFLRKGKWDKLSARAQRARVVGTRGRAAIGASLRF